jgi:hypothetical protein
VVSTIESEIAIARWAALGGSTVAKSESDMQMDTWAAPAALIVSLHYIRMRGKIIR